ncbi:MAG: hypothetical protein KIT70_09235 [Anaerolineales bacterium]|nr:MAG: hypothetical protein KIT70_09235 [Anaerolineales bacterium]
MYTEEQLSSFITRGLNGEVIEDLVPGWKFTIDETSNNVYLLWGENPLGDIVYKQGVFPHELMLSCIERTNVLNEGTGY